jgi:hypothetical protein
LEYLYRIQAAVSFQLPVASSKGPSVPLPADCPWNWSLETGN